MSCHGQVSWEAYYESPFEEEQSKWTLEWPLHLNLNDQDSEANRTAAVVDVSDVICINNEHVSNVEEGKYMRILCDLWIRV